MTQAAGAKATGALAREGIESAAGLMAVLATSAALGVTLWLLSGPPHLVVSMNWARIGRVLTGSRLPNADALVIAADIGWLALAYVVFSVVVRVLVVWVARRRAHGRWIRAVVRLSDFLTVPLVRRSVDSAVGGMLLLASCLPAVPAVRFRGAADPATTVTATMHSSGVNAAAVGALNQRGADDQQIMATPAVEYTVVSGDSLWEITRRFYGDGNRYLEIFNANSGRAMPDGNMFTDPTAIQPGWSLMIPLPAMTLSVDGGQTTYQVQQGDDLWGIATRFLGDGFRWPEIWELNRGQEMEPGRRFADPNLILPGWSLQLPIAVLQRTQPPVPPAPAPPSAVATAAQSAPPTPAPIVRTKSTGTAAHARQRSSRRPAAPREARDALFTAAGFAVLGGTAVFVRRTTRGRLRRGEGDGGHDIGDAGRVTLATRALRRALADFGFQGSRAIFVVEAEHALEFTIDCPPGDVEALVHHRYDLARRLACTVDGEAVSGTRAVFRLSGFHRLAALLADPTPDDPVLVVPVGATNEGILYLDLAAIGSVAVAGSERECGRLIAGWLHTLAVTSSPADLIFRADRLATSALGDAANLPPFMGTAGRQGDPELAWELDELLAARSTQETAARPLLVVTNLRSETTEHIQALIEDRRAVDMFSVVMGPGTMAVDTTRRFGASVVFGGSDRDEEATTADPDALVDGIAFTIRHGEVIMLEPVRVRTDHSTRWTEVAEQDVSAPPTVIDPDHGFAPAAAAVHQATSPAETVVSEEAGSAVAVSVRPADDDLGDARSEAASIPVDLAWANFAWVNRASVAGIGGSPDVAEPAVVVGVASGGEPPAASDPASDEATQAIPRPVRLDSDAREAWLASPAAAARQEVLPLPNDEPPSEGASVRRPQFVVRCFDGFMVTVDGREVSGWGLQKARELLAYLIVHGDASAPHDEVAAALWPEEMPNHAQRLLFEASHRLRRALQKGMAPHALGELLRSRDHRYHLPPNLFSVDIDRFNDGVRRAKRLEGAAAIAEYEQAIEDYCGELLRGEPFEWAEVWRREYRKRLVDTCRAAAALAAGCGELAKAIVFYDTLLEQEPLDEDAVRELMRCYVRRRDLSGARRVYQLLERSLRRELDDERAQPAAETRALLAELTARVGAA